jgi:hypothetical protein
MARRDMARRDGSHFNVASISEYSIGNSDARTLLLLSVHAHDSSVERSSQTIRVSPTATEYPSPSQILYGAVGSPIWSRLSRVYAYRELRISVQAWVSVWTEASHESSWILLLSLKYVN